MGRFKRLLDIVISREMQKPVQFPVDMLHVYSIGHSETEGHTFEELSDHLGCMFVSGCEMQIFFDSSLQLKHFCLRYLELSVFFVINHEGISSLLECLYSVF